MDCPLCNLTLQMTDREGVEIDYCPKCRGIWLDRGELEKLIALSVARSAAPTPPQMTLDDAIRSGHHAGQFADRRDHSDSRNRKPKKKESWLSNLLDFD